MKRCQFVHVALPGNNKKTKRREKKMISNYETLSTHTKNGYQWKLITDKEDGEMSMCIEYANGETMEYFEITPEDLKRLQELFAVASKAVN